MPDDPDVLILGAGPAGLAAAVTLHKAKKQICVIEKADCAGGLCRTLRYGDFKTDIGSHIFYGRDLEALRFIEEAAGRQLQEIDELSRFWFGGKFFPYPVIKIPQVLSNLGVPKTCKILLEYARESWNGRVRPKPLRSFEEYAITKFGKTLAGLTLSGFAEKILGLPAREISVDWVQRRTNNLSLLTLIKNSILQQKSGHENCLERFLYPESGTGSLYEEMKNSIPDKKGNVFKFRSSPIAIVHDNTAIKEVTLKCDKGLAETMRPGNLISSIPLTEFVTLLEPPAPEAVQEAARQLRFRSHVFLFLTLEKPSVFPDQWIHFPEKEIPFGRISEPKNFSARMSPKNATSLLIEFFCKEHDELWAADAQKLSQISLPWLLRLNFVRKQEIAGAFVHREQYAYPIYDLSYNRHKDTIRQYLAGFNNLALIGRNGCFEFNGQHQALENGITAAQHILKL